MSSDSLRDRGHAMEEMFFHDRDKALIARMRAELQAEENRKALASVTGIHDDDVLARLVDHGITAETLASVGLIPLVAVAWADGKMDAPERQAILRAAGESGIGEDQASFVILKDWLDRRPDAGLLDSWKAYVGSLRETLDPTSLEQVRNSVIGRARRVAEAAGGFLGLVNTIDRAEKQVLEELDSAFHG